MRIPIRLSNGTQTVEITALVDCGATGNFIDVGLLCLLELPLEKLLNPLSPITSIEPLTPKESSGGRL